MFNLFAIRSLQVAVKHTRRPMEVLTMYDTIFKLINETVKRSNDTRIAVDNLMNYVSIESMKMTGFDCRREATEWWST